MINWLYPGAALVINLIVLVGIAVRLERRLATLENDVRWIVKFITPK